ncbi:aminopeptidase [Halapricum desulfuricans]|uniref:Leucyl aminopeptidase (Aminopeptidase T) n=1 Tax=Halapricum desulfuricans TaxID=2841257 RepID=A0A897NXU9_9EURY|nr:aminopeptidase [Halapricum desulfuricans]QSG14916.1 Leucyl aminopeptidase (aminopeptidase T) [Halapricum desulfuricans]
MDDRIHEHAETLVDWSARIESGDDVVLAVDDGAHDLAVATARVLGERDANLISLYQSGEISRAYLQGHGGEFDRDPEYQLELYENADSVLYLGGGRNTAATADVPGDRQNAYSRARQAIREARMDTDWVSTVHPTRSLAQQAGMSHPAYEEFVYDAVLRDWEELAEEMDTLKEILDDGSEARIVGEDTDLTMSIEGRTAVNSAASVAYDSHNLPSGEVFTAPASPEGYVTFDVPMTVRGKRVRDIRLEFEDGVVVDYNASMNEAVIGEILDTDDGAKRLGELGIGMNRGIDRPTDSILFDEKMAETIHLAVGRAYDACLPDGEEGNESAVHVDLITNMDDGSRLLVDGEVIQRDGRFRWEDGFQS